MLTRKLYIFLSIYDLLVRQPPRDATATTRLLHPLVPSCRYLTRRVGGYFYVYSIFRMNGPRGFSVMMRFVCGDIYFWGGLSDM